MTTSARSWIGILLVGFGLTLFVWQVAGPKPITGANVILVIAASLALVLTGASAVWPPAMHVFMQSLRAITGQKTDPALVDTVPSSTPFQESMGTRESPQSPSGKAEGPGALSKKPFARETDVGPIVSTFFESSIPSYVLNRDYRFLDWNAAFEIVFGREAGVQRLEHVSHWTNCLENKTDVIEHGKRNFKDDAAPPPVDVEPIVYRSDEFGEMVFTKIASLSVDRTTGRIAGWNVVLNVNTVEKRDEFYAHLRARLSEQMLWARYAVSYDKVLCQFGPYRELIRMMTDAVSEKEAIIDLGAGTGNVTQRLLESGKEVLAVDYNEAMLHQLRIKCLAFGDRCTVMKGNLDSLRGIQARSYEGAILMNVLFALRRPEAVLRNVSKWLKRGGIIAVNVPNENSSLEDLFEAIRTDLRRQGRFAELEEDYENIWSRNQELEEERLLVRYSPTRLEKMLKDAGFRIIGQAETYAGQGLFMAARKP